MQWLVINRDTYEPVGPFVREQAAVEEATRLTRKYGGVYTVQAYAPRKEMRDAPSARSRR